MSLQLQKLDGVPLIGCCVDTGFKKTIYIDTQRVHGIWFWLVLFHESIHYFNPFEVLDEIYDKISLISSLSRKLMWKRFMVDYEKTPITPPRIFPKKYLSIVDPKNAS